MRTDSKNVKYVYSNKKHKNKIKTLGKSDK